MLTGLFCLGALLALYLSWQDWRTQSIPLWGLLAWVALCAFSAFYGTPSCMAFSLLFGVSICLAVYQYLRKQELIGLADLIVLTSLSAWIDVSKLPALFLLCGTLGILATVVLKNKRFPFLSVLFLAAAILTLF
ncbi:MAG: prepilin peptidase [Pseudomonadota bacterium]